MARFLESKNNIKKPAQKKKKKQQATSTQERINQKSYGTTKPNVKVNTSRSSNTVGNTGGRYQAGSTNNNNNNTQQRYNNRPQGTATRTRNTPATAGGSQYGRAGTNARRSASEGFQNDLRTRQAESRQRNQKLKEDQERRRQESEARRNKTIASRNPRMQDTARSTRLQTEEERRQRQDRLREAQKQKMGDNSMASESVQRAANRAVRNTPTVVKESLKQTAIGHGKTAADLTELNKSAAIGSKIDIKSKEFQEDIEKRRKQSTRAAGKAFDELSKMQEKSEERMQKVTGNAKGLEKAYYGALESGTGMALDRALGPAWAVSMLSRTYGNTRGQARKEGATEAEDRAYSLLQGAKEVATEYLFQGVGLARGLSGRASLAPSEKLAKYVTRNMSGRAADLTHAGIRLLGGTFEENAEEGIGWGVDPIIKELTYKKNVRSRQAQQMMREQSDSLRSNITSPQEAQAMAAYLGSDDFLEQQTRTYMDSGIGEAEARDLAEQMRDYLDASLSGDTGRMADIEESLTSKLAGKGTKQSLKEEYSFSELMDTVASTTLLTATTGLPGAFTTASKGAAVRDRLGDSGIRALAKTAEDFEDKEMQLKAKAMSDRLASGKDITSTQAYDLAVGVQEQYNKDSDRQQAAYQTANKTIKSERLVTPYTVSRNGNIDMDEVTDKAYQTTAKNAKDIIRGYAESDESTQSLTDTEIDRGSRAIAGFQTGVFTVDDANELNFHNTAVRSAFQAETGVDLNQYVVKQKNGEIDIPATNAATKDALFAMAADNLVKSAQAETANWMDNAKGEVVTQISRRMGAKGTEALQVALDDVDERDRTKYMMTANATDMLYQAARNMGTDWESAKKYAQRMFPSISEEKLKAMYDAGLEDRIAATDNAVGLQIEIGKKAEIKAGAEKAPMGQLLIETDVPVKGTVARTFTELAKNLGVDIHLVDHFTDKDGKVLKNVNGEYIDGNIYINVNSDFEKNMGFIFMHEVTHHLKKFAPEQYHELENLVREKWFKYDSAQMQSEIAKKIETYAKHGQTLTEEQALEEIIADAAHEFLTDRNFAREIANEDATLAQAVLTSIRNALRMLRRIMSADGLDETHMNTLFSQLDILDEAERLWLDAYKQAVRNNAAVEVDRLQNRIYEEGRMSVPDYSQEDMDAHRQALIDEMSEYYSSPYTDNYAEAGFVFPDGQMLRMGMDGQRGEDHRIASHAYDDISDREDALNSFINEGNIRWMPELSTMEFGVSSEPTAEQYEWIRDVARNYSAMSGMLQGIREIDFTDKNGETVESKIVTNESGDAIVNTIKRFYKTGTVEGGSQLSQFRYSISEEAREELNSEGIEELSDGTTARYSLTSWQETNKEKKLKALTAANHDEKTAKKWIEDIDSIASIILGDPERLDYEADRSNKFLKPNGDYYKYTLDASTLCDKRRIYQGTYNAIQHAMPDIPLMQDDVVRIRTLLKEKDHKAPCGICYVESQRKNLGAYAKEWYDNYARKDEIRLEDVTTSDGLKELKKTNPEVAADFEKAMAAKGVSSPKVVKLRTDYREDIMRMRPSTIEYLNSIGGLRFHSFSDFETPHLIDTMQAVMDMATKNLMGMAYAKVPNFAAVFGPTGIKINLSLIAKTDENGNAVHDENGRLVFDSVEGIPYEEAKKWRDAYPDNVAFILVGKDKEHTLEAINDDRVDFVIPFHRSKWSAEDMRRLGLVGYEDFATGHQENGIFVSEFWDYNKTGKQNAERYLEVCKERGVTPIFEQLLHDNGDGTYSLQEDGSTDNYWKLLVEGKMYNHITKKGAPQQPVKPNFNMDEARRVLKEYEGGANELPVADDVVEAFVKEYKEAHPDAEIADARLSISADLDEPYMAAVNAGNMEEAQTYVEQAAERAGYNTPRLYHGTPSFGFTTFDLGRGENIIFATSSPLTAETYSGETDRRNISDAASLNVDDLYGESLLKEASKYREKYKDYRLMTPAEQERLLDESRKDVESFAKVASDFIDEHRDAFNAEKLEIANRIVNALDRVSTAWADDMVDSAWNDYEDAVWDLKWIDESIQMELTQALQNNGSLLYAKNRVSDFMYAGDIYRNKYYESDYVFDNQLALELDADLHKGIYGLYGRGDNQLVVDANGSNWNQITPPDELNLYGPQRTRSIAEAAKAKGYDSVLFKNLKDNGGGTPYNGISDVYMFFNPSQVKSADPVTYAEDGSVIPLSQRFDPTNNDIRYSMSTEDADGNVLTTNQMEYFKNSQARDENGRLVPVYHTTNRGGFTIFDPEYSEDHRSLFFASNWDVSQTYGNNANNPIDVDNAGFKTWESFAKFAEENFADYPGWDAEKSLEENLKIELTPNKDNAPNITFEKWASLSAKNKNYHVEAKIPTSTGSEYYLFADSREGLLRDISSVLGKEFNQKGYYSCYLNLENPLIVDARGSRWNNIPYGSDEGLTIDEAISQIEENQAADYGITGIDVYFDYDDEGFPTAVHTRIGYIGVPDEMSWGWDRYEEEDSWTPTIEKDAIDAASVEEQMWEWAEKKLNELAYFDEGEFVNDLETNHIDNNGEIHYTPDNAFGIDFISFGKRADVSTYENMLSDKAANGERRYKTRELAEIAETEGYDGVIIYNCMDLGGDIKHGADPYSTIYIAFSSNQVKDTRNENPTENPDIRYSVTEDEAMTYAAENAKTTDDLWYTDPEMESDRVRVANSKMAYIESRITKWNERWLTEGQVLDEKSVKSNIRNLIRGVMANSDTDYQYKTEMVDNAVKAAKKAFYLRKVGKYSEAADLLFDTAQEIYQDNKFYGEDADFQGYKELRDFIRKTKFYVPEDQWRDIDMEAFRRNNFGSILLGSDGVAVDTIWEHMNSRWPEWFSMEVTHPADMMLSIEYALEKAKPIAHAYASEEAMSLAAELADDLDTIISEGKEYVSIADTYKRKYDDKTKQMKQRHNEAMRKYRENLQDKYKKRFSEWKKDYKEKQKNKADHRKLFEGIKDDYDWLSKAVLDPTKTKYIPEAFRASLAQLLMQMDLETARSKQLEKKYGRVTSNTLKLRELRDRLNDLATAKAGDDSNLFDIDSYLPYLMDALAEKYDGQPISAMDVDSLKTMKILFKALRKNFTNLNRETEESKANVATKKATQIVLESNARIDRDGMAKKYEGLRDYMQTINMTSLTPPYFFERMGTVNDLYKELRGGFDTYVRNEAYIMDRLRGILSSYYNKPKGRHPRPGSELEAWRDSRTAKTLELTNGTITMTAAQRMSLYCLTNRKQAMDHMLAGGIVVTPYEAASKIEAAKQGIKGKTEFGERLILSHADTELIKASLTPEQIKMANELQKLMSEDMARLGNEAHREMYGYEIFGEPNYFPIKSKDTWVPKDVNNMTDAVEKIKSFGPSKPLVVNASNAIVVDDIFSVVADHCNGMNLYNAYLVPISNFMRVYNTTVTLEDGSRRPVRDALEQAYGKKAMQYIDNFIRDLNGIKDRNRGGLEDIMNKAIGTAKATAVAGNLRVAAQQPTAYVRAAAEMDWKYLAPFVYVRPEKGVMDEMFEYCPIARWKSWGYYDTYMGRDIEDVMMNNWSIRDEVLSGVYGKLDNMTWAGIWQAVKAEQKDKHPEMDHESREFLEICGARASEIFDKTQVVDSTFHRSDAMRNKQVAVKLFTAFMSEPTLTLNVLRAAVYNYQELMKAGHKGAARKVLGKAISVLLVQAAFVSVAQALADAWRGKEPGFPWDDDDEEGESTYFSRFLQNLFHNFIEQLHLENNLYLVKDVKPYADFMMSKATEYAGVNPFIRTLMGWDQEYLYNQNNLVFAGLENTATGVSQLFKKLEKGEDYDKTKYEIIQKIASGIGTFTGLPVGTLMRDFKPIFDKLFTAVNAADTLELPSTTKTESDGASEKTEDSGEKKSIFGFHIKSAEEKAADKEEEEINKKIQDIKSKTEGLSQEEKNQKIYSMVTRYMKDHQDGKPMADYIAAGDYWSIGDIGNMYIRAGGDGEYFKEKVFRASKSAMKKTISADNNESQKAAQARIKDYLLTNGMTEQELSDIAYKSYTKKDLQVAFRINDEDAIITEMRALMEAGMTREDIYKTYDNRNRVDLVKYKDAGGKYADKLKSMGTYIWPCNGTITSHFGHRHSPGNGVGSTNHQGLDIGASMGAPVTAADGGTVVMAKWYSGYGKTVQIQHDDGTITQYSHLSWWEPKVGDVVAQGQEIGKVGSTGNSTGPHLHFGVMKDGHYVDPEDYLNGKS